MLLSILAMTVNLKPYRAGVDDVIQVVEDGCGNLRQVHHLRCTARKATINSVNMLAQTNTTTVVGAGIRYQVSGNQFPRTSGREKG